jgi:hypothetical protein
MTDPKIKSGDRAVFTELGLAKVQPNTLKAPLFNFF